MTAPAKVTAKPVLYSYFRSTSSWRLRLVMAYKGVAYEYSPVNLLKKEHLGEEFLKVNPMGQVPALRVGTHTLTQSVSIFEYLEEAHPQTPLLPKDIFLRVKVRELAELINSGIHPVQNLGVLVRLPEERRKEWARDTIQRGFQALEQLLPPGSPKFCVGNSVTWADICLVPQVFNANKFGVDMAEFPRISSITGHLEALPHFVTSHPHRQPDCPPELKEPTSS